MNRIDQTQDLFTNGGMNCAQAVLTVYGKALGIDEATARTLGRPLGGGVGVTGQICGFLTAAAQVLALANDHPDENRARSDTQPKVSALLNRFNAIHGAVTCNALLGVERSTPAGEKQIKSEGLVTRKCPVFGRDAAAILEEMLEVDISRRL